jgi:RNA polymerase sigma-70 factor (ECF subfamily)
MPSPVVHGVRGPLRKALPARLTTMRQSIRLAFVAALQHLPARQRAALILSEVLGWSAAEVAECLDTSTAAINSALQRARATLASRNVSSTPVEALRGTGSGGDELSDQESTLVERYVEAFHRYDVDGLVALLRDDAALSMPPFTLWLQGPDAIRAWLLGRGAGCRGSRLVATRACGSPAFAQYRPDPAGGHIPWSLTVLELAGGRIRHWNAFLDTANLFPRFGLPDRL